MFDLPEDAEITNIAVVDGMIIFEMVSAEESKDKRVKFIKTEHNGMIRRYNMVKKEHHTGGFVEGKLALLADHTTHEIHINIENQANIDDARKIAEEVIKELKNNKKGGVR